MRMRPRSIVFDLFGEYLRYRGGSARLLTLVSLLEVFGVPESTARVALARLRREGRFDNEAHGRETIYTLSAKSWAILDEGRARIFDRDTTPWDGQWRMVIYEVPDAQPGVRDEVRQELAWLGFGRLATSTWISPRDKLDAVADRLSGIPGLRLDLLRCQTASAEQDQEMTARCCDLARLDRDYSEFVKTYRPKLASISSGDLSPLRSLVLRTELVHDYRKFPFRDPDLPGELLPTAWHGTEAHEVFRTEHDLLAPAADGFIDEVLAAVPKRAADMTTEHADLLIRAEAIHTLVPGLGPQRALAVGGDRVLALSPDPHGLDALIGPDTHVVDAPGSTVLLAFDDTHTHLVFAGFSARDVPAGPGVQPGAQLGHQLLVVVRGGERGLGPVRNRGRGLDRQRHRRGAVGLHRGHQPAVAVRADVVSGYYEVVNDNAQSEGESWNITGGVGATAPGDTLQTWNYGGTGNTNALFASDLQYSGYYSFVADNSGLCLEAPSTSSGVQLEQYTCNGTPSQAFSLLP
jgi:phenylacetic acid degradation operon negative regulatory protein